MELNWIIQYTPESGQPGRWLSFHQPLQVWKIHEVSAVLPALAEIEHGILQGHAAAGYLSYEAAPAFDPAMRTHQAGSLPLLHIGLFRDVQAHDHFPLCAGEDYTIGDWTPSISQQAYGQAIQQIKEWIASGDTYQVNYTLRLQAGFQGDPIAWFHHLLNVQRPQYAAYLDDGEHAILSASPELFWSLQGEQLCTRPMKGTIRRGRYTAEDQDRAAELADSAKNRAENLMIVDMMRNDLGRIALTGSVATAPLFEVERYPTLWQMTSTVKARTHTGLTNMLSALFPSCSITGAPKLRTMEIIRTLETAPRGIYTGSIGFMLPNRVAQWNVAIRTAHIQHATGRVEYGTGGGIVWDSDATQEYRECAIKALIVTQPAAPFDLLETIRWHPGRGYWLLSDHLERLRDSAAFFDYAFDHNAIQYQLAEWAQRLPPAPQRIRLRLDHAGRVRLEAQPLDLTKRVWRVALDHQPTNSNNPFLCHKTTYRPAYDEARQRYPQADDVLLWNESGELTESCLANLLVRRKGVWQTPAQRSGLLNGALRRMLLRRGWIQEATLTRADLQEAERVILINSVRGWIPVELLN
jgi:para-aminobenzoate synthetase/4-amino-4-deoxychorismate lyase